jgi:hypothetical protein
MSLLLFVSGFGTLAHYGAHVRTVDAVALSGSGFSLGLGVAGLVAAVLTRKRV